MDEQIEFGQAVSALVNVVQGSEKGHTMAVGSTGDGEIKFAVIVCTDAAMAEKMRDAYLDAQD